MVQDLIETALRSAPRWLLRRPGLSLLRLTTSVFTSPFCRMCPSTFDEAVMFASQQDLKEEFRSHFRNITRIMDCVGCNTCRLWGKLKVHGLGTAMKILFADEGVVHLNRNEVVALFNTLNQYATGTPPPPPLPFVVVATTDWSLTRRPPCHCSTSPRRCAAHPVLSGNPRCFWSVAAPGRFAHSISEITVFRDMEREDERRGEERS